MSSSSTGIICSARSVCALRTTHCRPEPSVCLIPRIAFEILETGPSLERVMTSSYSYRLLQIALVGFGAVMILLYPLAAVWPSGWAWHPGAPYQSDYFMMIVGLYATLGLFLWNAARRPEANISLIWFTVWSSVVHAAIMAVQSFGSDHHMGHLWGDVPALILGAIVLSVLVLKSGLKQPPADLAARQVAGGRT